MTDREQITADWSTRGFSCDLWTDAPGQRWEDFTHATDEVVVVLDGEMEFEVEGQVHHPAPGEELLIPAGPVHSARNVGSTTARTVVVWLSAPLIADGSTKPLDRALVVGPPIFWLGVRICGSPLS